jgi:hypothetical protein
MQSNEFSKVAHDETLHQKRISSSKNALKLAYSKVQLQKFSGGNTPDPCFNGKRREGEGRGDPPRHFTMLAGL